MKKVIGMLHDGYFPPDIRIEKEATALINNGFEVVVICLSSEKSPLLETYKGITIVRLKGAENYYKKGICDVRHAINFRHPLFGRSIIPLIKKYNIQALHVHDLPLLKDGVLLKKRTGLPLVIDFHENYPEGMTSWSGWKKSFLINLKNRVLFSFKRWKKYEADYISKADAIIAVVEEMKEKFMREYNLKIPISVISNTEPKSFRDNNIDKLRMVARSKSGFTIAYIGGIDAIRGLDTVINAVPIMKEKIPGLIVNIIGGGSEAVFLKLRTQVKQLGLENTVYIPGPIPFEKVFNATHSADVCLIPHVKNEHTDHTIPHKLFQYMLTGKPIVVSNCKPLERIIAETACGLVFESGNANSFAEKIIELYANPDLRTTMGYNGVKATYEGRYNWDESGLDLVALYNGLLINE